MTELHHSNPYLGCRGTLQYICCLFFFFFLIKLTRIHLVLVKTIFKYVETSLKIHSPTLEMQIMVLTERKQGSLEK